MHKFNPKNKFKLISEERRKKLPPENILNLMELKKDNIFIDIGCGIGFFSIPAAEIVESNGLVYALDTSIDMVDELEKQAKKNNLNNLKTIRSKEYDFLIEDNIGDILLMSNVLHEVEDKVKFLKEANRILKKQGKISIIDWQYKESTEGPKIDHRISKEEVEIFLKDAGFTDIKTSDLNDDFYLILANKN